MALKLNIVPQITGLLDFDGIDDQVQVWPVAVTGSKTISFNTSFNYDGSTSDVFWVCGLGSNDNDYLQILYRPGLGLLYVAGKRVGGRKTYDINRLINKYAFIEIEKEICAKFYASFNACYSKRN